MSHEMEGCIANSSKIPVFLALNIVKASDLCYWDQSHKSHEQREKDNCSAYCPGSRTSEPYKPYEVVSQVPLVGLVGFYRGHTRGI